MMFVKLYFRTSDIYLISLVSLDPSGFHLQTKQMPSIEKEEPIYDVYLQHLFAQLIHYIPLYIYIYINGYKSKNSVKIF